MPDLDTSAEARVGQSAGRWTLERVIGSGGAAAVYAARDPAGAVAAVKVLHAEVAANQEVRQRFLREGMTAARIDHPGVVRVLEHAEIDERTAYVAMELLEGETLADRLERDRAIPLPELLDYTDQILDALAAAHDQGIVHRDLKPANLFITQGGRVKLLDFGVARLADPAHDRTRAGVMLGTVPYMAPEQALGRSQEIDGRTDLFALGAMMFRLVSGRRVHETATESQLLVAMASKPAPSLATVAPSASPELCAVVDVALAFSRQARYPDARTMQADVRALRSGVAPPHAGHARETREQATVIGARSPVVAVAQSTPDVASAPTAFADGAPASSAQPAREAEQLVGQVLADRYRIEKLLGAGGMGAVYRAEHVHMRKAVALKVLHREMTYLPEVVARFEREAVVAARIDHPNVAAAKDFGRLPDGSCYLVLEYVEGRSLTSLLAERGTLPAQRALHIGCQIVAALGAAHGAGIVHRDLKPDNVMLIDRDGDPDSVKVLDFGIAKLSTDDTKDQPALTRIGSVFGTPEYMSPEQAVGGSVDARSDLYTVGIMLYEMLAGHTPFSGDDGMASILTRQMTAAPPPLPASVDPRVSELVMTLLAKTRDTRVQRADELLGRMQALSDALSRSAFERGETVFGMQAIEPPPSSPWPDMATRPGVALDVRIQAALRRKVNIGGQPLPVWSLALVGALMLSTTIVLLGGIALAAFHGSAPSGSGAAAPGIVERLTRDPEHEALLARAASGDAAALKELEAKPASARKARDSRAIGLGHAHNGDIASALAAFQSALQRDKSLASDPEIIKSVRKAADDQESGEAALDLALKRLGSHGADLVYDVATGSGPKAIVRKAKDLLDSSDVRAKASPALAVLLDLRRAKKCSEYKELLPRVQEKADARAASALHRLASRRGCGFLHLSDCYSCLRRGHDLSDAEDAVKGRSAPDFGE